MKGGFATGFLGTKGLLSAFLAAFVTVAIYKVCVKNNVTIRMPDEVPPNISQVFKDVIPFTLSVVSLYGLDLLARHFVGASVAESIGKFFAPLFSAADGLCWYYDHFWCLRILLVYWYSRPIYR